MGKTFSYASGTLACFVVGGAMLVMALYGFINNFWFLSRAQTFEAAIVDVSREYVSTGKGSTLAYVPIVEIANSQGSTIRVKVDTYEKEPVYKIGDGLSVICDETDPVQCRTSSFWDMWFYTIVFSLIGSGLLLYGSFRRRDSPLSNSNALY